MAKNTSAQVLLQLPKLKLALLSTLLLAYPGQNQWQKLEASPKETPLRGISVDLGTQVLPYWSGIEAPTITATAAVVFEPVSGTILYQKNLDMSLPPASTTKIMTALVAMETYNQDEILPARLGPQAEGSSMELLPGEQLKVADLLLGLMVTSANDAALTLAENYPTGYSGFVERMNQLATEYKLTATQFTNVSGVGSIDHYSSVHDLVILAKHAFRSAEFRQLVATREVVVTDISGQNRHSLSTTNQLLGKLTGVSGVKTGWTSDARECLVTFVERDGKQLFLAVLGSNDRFSETSQLVEWAYASHIWNQL